MAKSRQMFWHKGIKFIPLTPQIEIDWRVRLVEQAIAGKVGFCYRNVKRYPLATGQRVRNEIERLKRERGSCESNVRAKNATFLIMQLREQEKEHWSFDETAYKQLHSNYQRLHAAMVWLQHEGYINHFTLMPSGRLEVSWFTQFEGLHIQVIEQGWTYEVRRDKPIKGVKIKYGDRVPVITVKEILDRHISKKTGLVYGTTVAKKAESHTHLGDLDGDIVTQHLLASEMNSSAGIPPEQREQKTELERKYPSVPQSLIRPSKRTIVR